MTRNYENLEEICNRWITDSVQTKISDVPSTLYHYTDAAGLLGMLKTGKVWATDFRFLNDRTELTHFYNSVKEYISTNYAGFDDSDKLISNSLLSYADVESPSDFYVFSLSEEKDDLSQWRGYAREGKGFTIGFSGSELLSLADASRDPEFAFVKVEYSHSKQINSFKRAMHDIKKGVIADLKKKDVDADDLYDESGRLLDSIISARSTISKHRSFSAEREWRLVVAEVKKTTKFPLVRASGLRLVPYIELDISTTSTATLPVVSIGIGPGFTGSEDIHAVQALCNSLGYSIDVYYADTPYRRIDGVS